MDTQEQKLPTEVKFEGWFIDLKTKINTGQYLNVIGEATEFLDQEEIGVEQKVAVLLQRGLAERMIADPRMYIEAINDFQTVLQLGENSQNPEWQLEALRCLIDAHRTSDRDPNFGPERLLQNLQSAQEYKQQAEEVMEQISGWSVAKVNVLIDFGLLALTADDNQGPTNAIEYYNQAEEGCLDLLKQHHPDAPDRYQRLKNVRAAVLAQSDDLRILSETIEVETTVHEEFIKMNHQRGSGDSAMVLGKLCEKLDQIEEAKEWYKKALGIANLTDGEADEDIANLASKALKKLEEDIPPTV